MPHEMITPLNGIFGLAQILSADANSLTKEEVAEYGSAILQSAERLHHTVQNFLLFGQLEMQASDPAAVATLQRQQTGQIRSLFEARARHYATRAARNGDLHLDVAEGAVAVSQELLIKLADELLHNAFKFSDPGSPVRVSGTLSSEGYVLSISDEGLGMETAQIAQIGAYAQFDRRQQEQQGSGLGLAIARRICELHGASLRLRSEKKKGTTVTVKMRPAPLEA
jgi:signal transduction histidine kinase